jgi:PilZ domain
MKSLKGLFGQLFSNERRRAERQPSPDLAAHYWNGGSPAEHSIRDISSTGLFVLTEERWYPGTLLIMTLQKKEEPKDGSERAIAVQSKAVRWGSDGVGLEFVTPDARDPRRGQSILAEGADRKSLEKFLVGFGADNGFVVIKYVLPPSEPLLGPSTAWS